LEQIQSGKSQFQPIDLDLVLFCRDLVDELNSDRAPRIVFDCSLDSLTIFADERLVRQVTVNILTNAMKYSPEDKPVELSVRLEGDSAVLKIRDYGIGIPEKDQEHLFEPFYRATNVGTTSGSGLGLVLAKQAVEMHRGSMTFISKTGLGTTFTVIFPRFGEYKR
jgi:signal transduction histidine kinase